MKDDFILQIERAYDSGELDSLDEAIWPEGIRLVKLFRANKWSDIYEQAPLMVRASACPRAKAFVIQWAVAATETEFDIPMRERMLGLWSEVPNWAADPYCSYVRSMQDGLTRFFAGSLRDASAYFLQAHEFSDSIRHSSGITISLFHLGLVEMDRGNTMSAKTYFTLSREVAKRENALNLIKRIEARLLLLSPDESANGPDLFSAKKMKLEAFLVSRNFSDARQILLEMDAHRRKLKVGRKRESLGTYLGLILCGLGRSDTGKRLISRISDPVLKVKILRLKEKSLGLETAELNEIQYLQNALGISSVVYGSKLDPEDVEIAGIQLASISDGAVKTLLRLLLGSPGPLSKEQIVQKVWGLRYDPVLHDKKAYKLIEKAKRLIGIPDLFLNTYGFYELNPRLLGKTSARSVSA